VRIRLKTWGRRAFLAALLVFAELPWPVISWGRIQRSASAAAVLEIVWQHQGGRFTVGAYSFEVGNQVFHGEDERTPTLRRGTRTWSRDELVGMHVCYEPARPGVEFALTPARYRCGDPDIITTDGGW
jgi:hypothetical protein